MTRSELKVYMCLVVEASLLRDKIKAARVPVDYPRVPQLTGMPGAHNTQPGSRQERLADDLMDRLSEWEDKLRELEARIRRIEAAVDRLPDKERIVTRLHCLEGMTYQAIGDKLHYSASTISAIQMGAYKTLEEQNEQQI